MQLYKISIFTLLSFFSTNIYSDAANISTDPIQNCFQNAQDDKWKYVEYLFVVCPTEYTTDVLIEKQTKIAAITAAVLLTYIPTEIFLSNYAKISVKLNNYSHVTSLAIAALAYRYYLRYSQQLKKDAKFTALFNVISEWEFHRASFPDELVPLFDEMYALYQEQNLQDLFFYADSARLIIQQLLEHHYEKRYSRKDDDYLSMTKTVTDIRKNIL